MRVFVLSTGRCGTTTLARACSHITNFTCAHESNWGRVGPDRFEYPDQHIEIDNRLSWFLGELYARYGDEARYVHLIRDPEKTALSFTHRWNVWESSITGYARHLLCVSDRSIEVARAHVTTMNANISHFLRDKPHTMTLHLETLPDQYLAFLEWIGAHGDSAAAIDQLRVSHNSTETSPPRSAPQPPSTTQRIRRRLAKIVAGQQPRTGDYIP
jgi:hypothetical protein